MIAPSTHKLPRTRTNFSFNMKNHEKPAQTHSTRFSESKTSLPMLNACASSTPGALNFSGASRKLNAHTNPSHKKLIANE